MVQYLLKHPQQMAPILKALRLQSGLSQAELAAQLGVTHQAISQLEKRPDRVSLERLMRVLNALRVELVVRPRTPNDAPAGEW